MSHDVWSILLLIGAWGWILSALGLAFSAFPGRNRFDARIALRWGGGIVAFFALWVVGMINA